MPYSFRYSLTKDDFAAYNIYAAWSAPWLKASRLRIITRNFIYSGLAMFATIILLEKFDPPRIKNNLLLIIVSVILLVILTLTSYALMPSQVTAKAIKFIEKPENAQFLDEREVILDEKGLSNETKLIRTFLAWDAVVRYAVTKDYFFLFVNGVTAYIIPKRIFHSQQEIGEVDNYLTERIPLTATFRSLGI